MLKNLEKLLLIGVIAVMFVILTLSEAYASTVNKDGLDVTVTTDKPKYSIGENIKINVTIKNNNKFAIQDIDIDGLMPKGLELVGNFNPSNKIEKLLPGETITYTNNVIVNITDIDSNEENSNGTSINKPNDSGENTDDSNNSSLPITGGNIQKMVIIFVGIGLVAVGFYISKSKSKDKKEKIISLILASTLGISFLAVKDAEAEDVTTYKNKIKLVESIMIDNKSFDIGVEVSWNKSTNNADDDKLDHNIDIKVNEIVDNEVLRTDKENIKLSGIITVSEKIKDVKCIVYSNSNEVKREIEIEGDKQWKTDIIKLDIGTNFISIFVETESGKYNEKQVLVNRESTIIKAKDNVIGFIPNDTSSINEIKAIFDTILETWTDDKGTTEQSDDEFNLIVKNDNPIYEYIQNDTIQVDSIIYITACEYFPKGLTVQYKWHDDNYIDGMSYNTDEYEIIHTGVPAFADVFEGDISLNAEEIDSENPLAFITTPENSENILRRTNLINSINIKVDDDGKNIELDFLDFDLNEHVSMNGTAGLYNMDTLLGLEWNISKGVLPQQIISKYSWDMKSNLKLEFTSKNPDKDDNTLTSIDVEGSKQIAQIGLNMLTLQPTYVSLKTSVSDEDLVKITPVALIYISIDSECNVEVSGEIGFNFGVGSNIGVNSQQEGFVGSYGTCKDNIGDMNFKVGDRCINIYNYNNSNQISTFGKFSFEGKSGMFIGVGAGISIFNVLPLQVKIQVGPTGKGVFAGDFEFDILKWQGQSNLMIDLEFKVLSRAFAQVYLKAKTKVSDVELDYKSNIFEIPLYTCNFKKSSTPVTFKIYENVEASKNTIPIKDSKITIMRDYITYINGNSNESGEFTTSKLVNNSYKVIVEKEGYKTYKGPAEVTFDQRQFEIYLEKDTSTGGNNDGNVTEGELGRLKGTVYIADEDSNISNNKLLNDAKINLYKEGQNNSFESVQTDTNGKFNLITTTGTYRGTVTKDGYLPIDVKFKVGTQESYIFEMIPCKYEGNGNAEGVLTSQTKLPVRDKLRLDVVKGNYMTEGNIIETAYIDSSTKEQRGKYKFTNLPAGNYTVLVTDPRNEDEKRYLDSSFNIKVLGNNTVLEQNSKVELNAKVDRVLFSAKYDKINLKNISSVMGQRPDKPDGVMIYIFYDKNNIDSTDCDNMARDNLYVDVQMKFVDGELSDPVRIDVPLAPGNVWVPYEVDFVKGEIHPINYLCFAADLPSQTSLEIIRNRGTLNENEISGINTLEDSIFE